MDTPRYWGGDIPWVSSGEMKQRRISSTSLTVTEQGAREGTKLVPERTVLAVVRGMSLAKEFRVAITQRPVTFNQDLKALVPSERLFPEFLFYYLLSQNGPIRDSASESGHGTKKLDTRVLEDWPLPLPPLPIQRKIAAVLSAYDELIETNQRRIALLEKLAEEIYREWFVRLRFPGHEKVKKIKGVPEGWRVAELRELAKVNPSSISRQNKPENILYVDISSVSTNRIEGITPYAFNEAPGRARRRVEHGDVIWSSVRPANRAYSLIFDPPENLIVSTGFAVIRPNKRTPFTFLFFAVTSNSFVDQMTAVAKGAAYPATSFDDFEKAKLLVPIDDLLSGFHDVAEPLFRQKHLLQEQNTHLTRTRDLLLPRLISGKLSVEDLDIQFPPGMAEEGRDLSPKGPANVR
jgi:type I restriction enzyme S subunit